MTRRHRGPCDERDHASGLPSSLASGQEWSRMSALDALFYDRPMLRYFSAGKRARPMCGDCEKPVECAFMALQRGVLGRAPRRNFSRPHRARGHGALISRSKGARVAQ